MKYGGINRTLSYVLAAGLILTPYACGGKKKSKDAKVNEEITQEAVEEAEQTYETEQGQQITIEQKVDPIPDQQAINPQEQNTSEPGTSDKITITDPATGQTTDLKPPTDSQPTNPGEVNLPTGTEATATKTDPITNQTTQTTVVIQPAYTLAGLLDRGLATYTDNNPNNLVPGLYQSNFNNAQNIYTAKQFFDKIKSGELLSVLADPFSPNLKAALGQNTDVTLTLEDILGRVLGDAKDGKQGLELDWSDPDGAAFVSGKDSKGTAYIAFNVKDEAIFKDNYLTGNTTYLYSVDGQETINGQTTKVVQQNISKVYDHMAAQSGVGFAPKRIFVPTNYQRYNHNHR